MRIYLETTATGPEGSFLGEREYGVPDPVPEHLARAFVDAGCAHWVEEPEEAVVKPEAVETATEPAAPENAAKRTEAPGATLPPWTLSVSPREYLDRYGEDAKNSDLAKLHVDAD